MGEEGLEPSAEARSSRAFAGGGKDSGAVPAPAKLGLPLAESTVTLSHEPIYRTPATDAVSSPSNPEENMIADQLEAARALWLRTGDEKTLRRALLDVL